MGSTLFTVTSRQQSRLNLLTKCFPLSSVSSSLIELLAVNRLHSWQQLKFARFCSNYSSDSDKLKFPLVNQPTVLLRRRWSHLEELRRDRAPVRQLNLNAARGIATSSFAQLARKDGDDDAGGRGDKTLRVKLKAQRLDAVLKAGLGLSRNKVEKAVYDDRVRVNGERPQKKSQTVYEGDEIDVVRGYNDLNPDGFIDVSRVEIVKLTDSTSNDEDSDSGSDDDDANDFKIPAVLRRSKQLTIKNYSPRPWKGSSRQD